MQETAPPPPALPRWPATAVAASTQPPFWMRRWAWRAAAAAVAAQTGSRTSSSHSRSRSCSWLGHSPGCCAIYGSSAGTLRRRRRRTSGALRRWGRRCHVHFRRPFRRQETEPGILCCRRLLGCLARLRAASELQPAAPQFSLAAFSVRCVLDDFAEHVGPDLLPPAPTPPALANGSAGSDAAGAPTFPALATLAAADVQVDSRFLHLCCPMLEHARALFGTGGGLQPPMAARRVKKIRPTAPAGSTAARVAALQVRGERCWFRVRLWWGGVGWEAEAHRMPFPLLAGLTVACCCACAAVACLPACLCLAAGAGGAGGGGGGAGAAAPAPAACLPRPV